MGGAATATTARHRGSSPTTVPAPATGPAASATPTTHRPNPLTAFAGARGGAAGRLHGLGPFEGRIGLLKQAWGVATGHDELAIRYEAPLRLALIRQSL
ncbi:hypothetical protein [Streptomyces sp. NPDC002215]|uniref:hypothetical protein n=1 Tax=Streptomyces sp. NPDC002215 TaxID=3154412 RepID=UPI003326D832